MADPQPTDQFVVPTSAVRVARIGGTVAELAAAAISAHTLYHLGGQLDLGPATAWLLPAALDVYAFTALAVGYSLPLGHPGHTTVLRNARLAFAMTLGANALDHFLQKAGRLVDPTVRDLLLITVATLPPLVVERLLNLQSLLVGGRTVRPRQEEAVDPSAPLHLGQAAGQGLLAHGHASAPTPATDQSMVHLPKAVAVSATGTRRPDWSTAGAAVFADLSRDLGRRPSAREFQAALADHVRHLIASGQLRPDARPPSVTTAKRIRTALEAAGHTDHQPLSQLSPTARVPHSGSTVVGE